MVYDVIDLIDQKEFLKEFEDELFVLLGLKKWITFIFHFDFYASQ